MEKDIYTLLNNSTSKWKKDDWISAAQFLANKERPKGIIDRIMYDGLKNDLCDRVNKHGIVEPRDTGRRRGRPEKLTKQKAELMLNYLEKKRIKLAEEKGIPPSKITDKEIAMWFEEHMDITGKDENDSKLSKYQRATKLQNWFKSLKKKVKSG